jgi:hypothetical protein
MIEFVKKWGCRAAIIAVGAVALSCEEVPQVPAESLPNIPAPTTLSGFLSSDGVQLFWEFDTTYSYSEFQIYRSEDGQASWFLVATVPAPPYSDDNLRSQFTYWYRVAGVDVNGISGDPSVSWPARPAVYEVLIDDGAPRTSSLEVLLFFTAPVTTQNVRYAETEDLTGEQWRDFELPPYPYTLTPVDGIKTVWAQFIDSEGNLTQPVSSTIELDTYAAISDLIFEVDNGKVENDTIQPGGTVRFVINTAGNEPGGSCEVFIEGQGATPVMVYDDGRNGDTTAGDGIYERNYTFALSFRQRSMRMSAVFIDVAGNTSVEREFERNMYMSDPPDAVDLNPETQSTADSITLNWTRSIDDHFTGYKIYRRSTQPVDPINSVLAGTVSSQSTTVFTDTGLAPLTDYWYAVYVVNDLDEGTTSNIEVQGTTTN